MIDPTPTDDRGLPLRVWTVGLIDHLFRDCPAIGRRDPYMRSRAGIGAGRTKLCGHCLKRWPLPGEES